MPPAARMRPHQRTRGRAELLAAVKPHEPHFPIVAAVHCSCPRPRATVPSDPRVRPCPCPRIRGPTRRPHIASASAAAANQPRHTATRRRVRLSAAAGAPSRNGIGGLGRARQPPALAVRLLTFLSPRPPAPRAATTRRHRRWTPPLYPGSPSPLPPRRSHSVFLRCCPDGSGRRRLRALRPRHPHAPVAADVRLRVYSWPCGVLLLLLPHVPPAPARPARQQLHQRLVPRGGAQPDVGQQRGRCTAVQPACG